MSVTVTVVVPADHRSAWDRWADLPAWPSWNPACRDARLRGPLSPGTALELRLVHPRGRDFWTRPRLAVVDPPVKLAWRATAPGLMTETATSLSPEPDGTRVTLTAESRGRMAFAFRMTLSERAQARMYADMLDALSVSFGRPG